MMPFLFKIARKSAWILVAAMIVALFSGVMLVRYQLFSWISYGLIRDIHVFFILIVLIPVFYLHTLGGIMMLLKRKGLANKKILTASVIIGWTAVFLVFGFVYSYTAPATSGNTPAIKNTSSSGFTLTPAEIAKHGSAGSCWVIIGGNVYDLTGYISIHPGGSGEIIPYCGKDGTIAFATKNSGDPHSSYATSLLNSYFIGDFGAAVIMTPLPTGTTIPVPREEDTPLTPSGPGSSSLTLTPVEIAKHGSSGSCWMIIGGKVYDLTSYIGIHPGGSGEIIPYCGKDGTIAFATKNSGDPHSSYATSLLNSYFIGDFGATVTTTPGLTGTIIPLPRGRSDDDDDDD
ncbi:MAG: cytochrome b5 domain-containing protein [Methanoregula sp.]|nr:cytochrome b5 domain-containing protein [Methanoregula sp.]